MVSWQGKGIQALINFPNMGLYQATSLNLTSRSSISSLQFSFWWQLGCERSMKKSSWINSSMMWRSKVLKNWKLLKTQWLRLIDSCHLVITQLPASRFQNTTVTELLNISLGHVVCLSQNVVLVDVFGCPLPIAEGPKVILQRGLEDLMSVQENSGIRRPIHIAKPHGERK